MGLCHVHKHGIIHRDIKPANVMIEENASGVKATLIDFGLSRDVTTMNADDDVYRDFDLSADVGTVFYRPPEQVLILFCLNSLISFFN